ncbi:ABC transporter ATP-binding protein [Marinobacter sp. NFXS9]|uniref:ABC transporter ATP-binding protein n=1 Tax=Marinobacter sp. NFXS9 TaxID=2818433 RepID=UPI0032DFA257
MKLTAEHLVARIHGRTLLDNVSLTIRPGETFALVGPNGSGKSTLLRLLAGLRRPARGGVCVDGRPLANLKRRIIARSMALVEQQAETSDRLCVRDAVALGRTPFLSPLRPWSDEDDSLVDRALDDVDMRPFADRLWHTLSGGERQRVHIARALAQQPRILLLDEPTNHLDIQHQLSILNLVRRLPVTVVIALHDLNQAMACDRVGILDEGRLVAVGPPEDVLTPDQLWKTFKVQADRLDDPLDGRRILRFRQAP